MRNDLYPSWPRKIPKVLTNAEEQILSLNRLPRLEHITLIFEKRCVTTKILDIDDVSHWTCELCELVMNWLFFRLKSNSARLRGLAIRHIPTTDLNSYMVKKMRPVFQGLRNLQIDILWSEYSLPKTAAVDVG